MSGALEFFVRSSSGDGVYQLKAHRTQSGIRFSCTCEAAENGQHCKHRLSLIAGDVSKLESANTDDVSALATLIRGSPLDVSIARLASLEAEANRVKREISAAKKTIAHLMMG